MVIDALRDRNGWDIEPWHEEKKFKAFIAQGTFGEKIILAKPTTYMNNSGEAVRALMSFYKIEPTDLYVIYDDIDLPIGTLRIRPDGSSGTHNGMKSLVEHLGTQNFPRIRIGIESRPENSPIDTSDYVLGTFTAEERKTIAPAIAAACDAIETCLTKGVDEAMNTYN